MNAQENSVEGGAWGFATVATILNGLGFSNRQLYLMPQYFENNPVEHLLGEGITADMRNSDCLERTLDWLYERDVTTLFAGLALQGRQRFGIQAQYLHIDTTFLKEGITQLREQVPNEHEQRIAIFDSGDTVKPIGRATMTPRSGGSVAFQKPPPPQKPPWRKGTSSGKRSQMSQGTMESAPWICLKGRNGG